MNSPKKAEHHVLGVWSKDEIRKFLMECVNLPDPISYPPYRPHFERWLRKWQGIFTFQSEGKDGKWCELEIPRERLELFVPKMQAALYRIWSEQDVRQRDWYLFRLRDAYHHMIVRAENPELLVDLTDRKTVNRLLELEGTSHSRKDNPGQRARFFESWMGTELLEYVPKVCQFEASIYWLQINSGLMLRCGGPTCAAPYFFRTEKGQKYCSPECADPARRGAKLRWWNENRAKKKASRR